VTDTISVLPYSKIVGQHDLRHALEVGYVGRLGVLATGQRGTAKSTTIRAFSKLVYGHLPVTMPLGVTDDRVLGGRDVNALLGATPEDRWQPGLIQQAAESGMLYVDEINLLEDHIVNLVLDAAATGILTVQRDSADRVTERHDFAMVGSMNPDEGPLRPQLLDRFGMVVPVRDYGDVETRRAILSAVLAYDLDRNNPESAFMTAAKAADAAQAAELHAARLRFPAVTSTPELIDACAAVAEEFQLVGHRGELVMLQAARARAALDGAAAATVEHLRPVATAAIIHRRPNVDSGPLREWGTAEIDLLARLLGPSTG
jgi:magnesium chelatase subunit I